jgi:glycosyltransferase involved in cell wall biosynthesis
MRKLNVLLVSYNQSDFIEECVNSILMQKADFGFNVIVADDCSADGTLDKIKRLVADSNIEFVFLRNFKNLGLSENYKRAFSACDAEYIAVMEGDDFWTTPHRLQKHIDFLDNHLECVMSVNNRIDANYKEVIFFPRFYSVPPGFTLCSDSMAGSYFLVSARDAITHFIGGNFSTCVYRKQIVDKLPSDWLAHPLFGDIRMSILICEHGYMGYLMEIMSIYRIHEKGLWSGKDILEKYETRIRGYNAFNLYTNKIFENEIALVIKYASENVTKLKNQSKGEEEALDAVLEPPKRSFPRRALRCILRLSPPVLIWVLKALIPKMIMEKIRERILQS